MNLNFMGVESSIREVPGFDGFSKLKNDGILRTGLETRVSGPNGVQAEISKISELQFPHQFACNGNTWVNPDDRVVVEQRKDDYLIRYYDTTTGFEADTRVHA